MVHYNCSRIGTTLRSTIFLITAIVIISSFTGCGGGGSSPARVTGSVTDPYGAILTTSAVTLTLGATGVVGHPDTNGVFTLSADPGTYTLTASYVNVDAGIRIAGSTQVTLVEGQTANAGTIVLSNNLLEAGWSYYRQEQYNQAESAFNQYLDNVRTGQTAFGASSAYCGLGWTRGRGLDRPLDALSDFNDALTGWPANTDALVGTAACQLSLMKYGGSFRFNDAVSSITAAIDTAGDYSGSPAHDSISEIDLRAFRAYVNFLNGNETAAETEASAIQQDLVTEGNRASREMIAVLNAFTE